MKKLFTFFLCTINLMACTQKNIIKPEHLMVGIVKTTSNTKKSEISFYNENLNLIKSSNCSAGELGTNFSQAIYLDNKAYVVARGVSGKYDDKKVVEIDMNNLSINEYNINRINLQKVGVTNKNLFITSNLNFTNYLTKIDFNSNLQAEITSENYMELVAVALDKVCLFESNSNSSLLKIYNKNLDLIKSIDISSIGNQHAKYTVYKNKLIFSNPYINDVPNNTISIFDLDTYEIKTIALNYPFPNDLLIFNNHLIVSHTSDVQPEGNILSIINLSDFSIEKEVELDEQIMRIELYKDILLVLSPKNEKNISKISTYDLKNNIKKTDTINISLKDNEYISCIFVNQNHNE